MNISQKFRMWLVVSRPGEEFAYHNGLLARDREKAGDVEQVAADAMLAARQGLVDLFQRRLPYTFVQPKQGLFGGCLYIARRRDMAIPRVA